MRLSNALLCAATDFARGKKLRHRDLCCSVQDGDAGDDEKSLHTGASTRKSLYSPLLGALVGPFIGPLLDFQFASSGIARRKEKKKKWATCRAYHDDDKDNDGKDDVVKED